jgi:hypothetical protein
MNSARTPPSVSFVAGGWDGSREKARSIDAVHRRREGRNVDWLREARPLHHGIELAAIGGVDLCIPAHGSAHGGDVADARVSAQPNQDVIPPSTSRTSAAGTSSKKHNRSSKAIERRHSDSCAGVIVASCKRDRHTGSLADRSRYPACPHVLLTVCRKADGRLLSPLLSQESPR